MGFGEKIYKLRKEHGLSQEALAEKLDTTRQAISKWENNQGYPETEKLLLLSNIFEVSVDYLLKDTTENRVEHDKGYYVSREMAAGYLLSNKKQTQYVAAGISLLICSAIPYFLFRHSVPTYIVSGLVLATLGIVSFVVAGFADNKQYTAITKEPLILDPVTLKELKDELALLKRKHVVLSILGTVCVAFSGLSFLLTRKGFLDITEQSAPYYALCVFLFGAGVYILCNVIVSRDTYAVLLENDQYVNRFSARLARKSKKVIEKI
ncbi:helix-turn-helix domain-containing protein [Paenibacillus donghaensis]|uniref:HTH cro/C1-type domain-containing protein n=1 Tax=Paenibacillus donghaensis TaxID=414771 RepID=A0A2Z2KSW7_9BACL|nr:helix-turn-helix transcriptional regulator [Paenibacillus donghaensis]ASA24752.1 hypothetical protein B9T62_30745 [Paenibacillus donghaensis]